MDRTPVKSSNVTSVGYDPETRVLEVEFRGGAAYSHKGVPQATYDGLMAADSKGRYYFEHLRGRYECEKV